MAFQPLTKEQYQNAINAGFSHEQIVQNEVQRKASSVSSPVSVPKRQDLLDNSLTRGVQSFFPGAKLGQALGTQIGLGVTKVQDAIRGTNNAQYYDRSQPNNFQIAGDVAGAGLTAFGVKGANAAVPFLQRVIQNFGLGAGLGATQSIADGNKPIDVAKNALTVGALGAGLSVAGAGLRQIGKQINTLPDRLINSALGKAKPQILKELTSKEGSTLNKYILSKPLGTAQQMATDATVAVENLSKQIQSKLASAVRQTGSKVTIGTSNILDDVANTPEAYGALMKRADVVDVVTRLAPQSKRLLQKSSLTLEEANQLRQLLDSTLGDRAFLGGQLTNDKLILKSFANTLRETVKTKAPKKVRGLFAELANEIKLRDDLFNMIAQKSKNQILSFGDLLPGAIGGVFGGGLPGAAIGIAARRAAGSVPAKIGSAKVIKAVSKVAPLIDEMSQAQQTAIMVLISDLISPDENDRE